MSLRTGAPWTRTRYTTGGFGHSLEAPADWAEPEAPKRDYKKLFLIVGLAGLSWVATYVGMLELIESNMGSLPILHKLIIGFSVAMLMTMVVWLLDQMFSPIDWFTRLSYVFGYVFLSIISIGFGFGFYWKVLESRSEAARSAESAVGQVQSSLHGASTRLEQLQATLVQLSAMSTTKAEIERNKGTSCPNSARRATDRAARCAMRTPRVSISRLSSSKAVLPPSRATWARSTPNSPRSSPTTPRPSMPRPARATSSCARSAAAST